MASTCASSTPAPLHSSLGEQVLSHAQSGREVIQDFVPLADSLEWELGQQYLRERGNKAFISDASPSPSSSTMTARSRATPPRSSSRPWPKPTTKPARSKRKSSSWNSASASACSPASSSIISRNCAPSTSKNYYDRLCYVAADRSERMLLDVLRHGVLGNHPGRYLRPPASMP